MASAQEKNATIMLVAESPAGDRKKIFSGIVSQTGPGGAPDGVQATVKDNELPFMPLNQFAIPAGWKVVPVLKLAEADGVDVSDCVFNVPVRDQTGAQRYLNTTDLGMSTDLPASTPAGQLVDLGTGYTVPESQTLFIGGGKYFISVEDDTA